MSGKKLSERRPCGGADTDVAFNAWRASGQDMSWGAGCAFQRGLQTGRTRVVACLKGWGPLGGEGEEEKSERGH
eukprot:597571-Rhodomonas_salina.2